MVVRTDAYIGNAQFPVLEVRSDHPLFYDIYGKKIIEPWTFWDNFSTVAFARSPDNECPVNVYIARKTPKILRELRKDGYKRGKELSGETTILRRIADI